MKEIKQAVEEGIEKKPNSQYNKFRIFEYNKKIILAGKSAGNNEEIVKQVSEDEEVFHTALPGSPFVNIKGKADEKTIKQAAIFCASKSQAWRDNHSDILVHQFKGKDIYKKKGMKLGTFGVKNFKEILVKKSEIENFIEKQNLKNQD
jgi:predicted ribosome quality control (RQC) complex YloA/Tae2 family protein